MVPDGVKEEGTAQERPSELRKTKPVAVDEKTVGMREFLINTHKWLKDGVTITKYGVPVFIIKEIPQGGPSELGNI